MATLPPPPPAKPQPLGMRERIGRFDWAATPLGPRDKWPAALRFAVNLCEHSSMPMAVYWGPDLRLLYNDAWAPFAGNRHPGVLGEPADIVWADHWDRLQPRFDQVLRTGEGVSIERELVPVMRGGLRTEIYWSYSMTPLLDEAGRVAGVISQGNDVTGSVLADRRLSYQVQLADALRECGDPQAVKDTAARLLGEALGADRVGYAEVDPARMTLSVRNDWTRGGVLPSLAGEVRMIDAFGTESNDLLMSGNVLATDDIELLAETDPEHVSTLRSLGARAIIVVPLIRGGSMRALLYVHHAVPRTWGSSDIAIVCDTAERTWDAVQRAQSEQSLRESEDHYRHVVELNPQVSWTADPEGHILRISARWEEWTGTTGLGDDWALAVHPDDRLAVFAERDAAVRLERPFDIEHRIRRRDGSYRWARSRSFPRYGPDGKICLWYGMTEDIHERHQAQEHQRLLINELNHRVKNTLATVQAIAFQTLKDDLPLAEARARFEARLLALSRAHNLLTEENWEGASISRVIADSTAHLAGESGRFSLEGESLWLAPRAALALALACHELSTNAAKYGALSNEKGHVSVRWLREDGQLRIEWKETGGPPVSVPSGRGFGSRLIERGLAGDLNGRARLDFEPDGLKCTIEAPLSAVQAREGELGG
ncbi:MAG TPA: HWE histidine kinase domain-containing protein [Allosphingosinicella sp.]